MTRTSYQNHLHFYDFVWKGSGCNDAKTIKPTCRKIHTLWNHLNTDLNMSIGIWTCGKAIKKHKEKDSKFQIVVASGGRGEEDKVSTRLKLYWSELGGKNVFYKSECFIKIKKIKNEPPVRTHSASTPTHPHPYCSL